MNGSSPHAPDDLEPLWGDDELPRRQIEAPSPTRLEPTRGLPNLAAVAVVGRDQILKLASTPVVYAWQDIAVGATIVLLAGDPGGGKTTALFLILAARANVGDPVEFLARKVTPAPSGTWLVIIEGEHAESSACRKLVRSMKLLDVHDVALDRVILVARKAVRLGSPEWLDVVKLVAAGLVSDIAIDTVARVMPADGSSEQEQVQLFDQVAQAIDSAPTFETRPIVWAVAHTRKNGQTGDLADVSGSAQRTGQADSVLLLKAERDGGRVVASRVTFAKLREDPDEYPMPISFSIVGDRVVNKIEGADDDGRPIEARIVELLTVKAHTKTALAEALKRSRADIDAAISNLFTARAIRSTTTTVRGRERKAFCLAPSTTGGNLTGLFTGPADHRTDTGPTPDES